MRHLSLAVVGLLVCLAMSVVPSAAGEIKDVVVSGDSVESMDASGDPSFKYYPVKSVLVKDSGTLYINTSFKLDQSRDDQYTVTIEDEGTVIMDGGRLFSDYGFTVTVKGQGKLVMKGGSSIECSRFKSEGDSSITIEDDSGIDSGDVVISCAKLSVSSDGFQDVEIESVGSLSIEDATVSGLDIASAGKVSLTGARLEGSSIGDIDRSLVADSSRLDGVDIGTCAKVTIMNGSKATGLNIDACEDAAFSDSAIDGLTIGECDSILLDSCDLDVSQDGLDSLAAIGDFRAVNQSFGGLELRFSGSGDRVLENVTDATVLARDGSSVDIYGWKATKETADGGWRTGGITVEGSGEVRIFRYLTVKVIDRDGDPVPDAAIRVTESMDDAVLAEGATGEDGTFTLALGASTITNSSGTQMEDEHWYYRVEATYDDVTNGTDLQLDDDKTVEVPLDVDVVDGGSLSTWKWIAIGIAVALMVIIFAILVARWRPWARPKKGPKGHKRKGKRDDWDI